MSPRLSVDVVEFENLRASLDRWGLVQPILVRSIGRRRYSVISGHRRFLAAGQLGWERIPARVLDLTEREALRVRILENLHRESLGWVELAEAVERYFLLSPELERDDLEGEFGIPEDLARELLDLLRAPPEVRASWIYGGSADLPALRDWDELSAVERYLASHPRRGRRALG